MAAEIRPGLLYRHENKWPTASEYDEAIEELVCARSQLKPDGRNCAVCGDSGHQAFECHHNPLVVARRWTAATSVWRCYHCGFTATNDNEAHEHFGRADDEVARCIAQRALGVTGAPAFKQDIPFDGELGTEPSGTTSFDAGVNAVETAKPLAWAVFAPNGNIRMWSTDSEAVRKVAAEHAQPLTPLYAHPPTPGVEEPLLPCGRCGTKPGPDDLVFCPNEKCGAVLVTQAEADEHAAGVRVPHEGKPE